MSGPRRTGDPTDRNHQRAAVTVFLLLVAIFGATAQWRLPYHIDALTNAMTGWYVGNEGTVILKRHEEFANEDDRGEVAWITTSERGPVSQYPPGAALLAGFVYAVAPGGLNDSNLGFSNDPEDRPRTVPMPALWPATASAVLATAGACGLLTLVFARLGGSPHRAIAAGLVAGLATAAWSVASDASWTHGPAMLLVACTLWAAQGSRWALAGLSTAGAILVRPHLGVIAAVIGLGLLLRARDVKSFLVVGMTSSLGLGALLAYNAWLFDRLSVSGGYGSDFESRFSSASLSWFLGNVIGGFLDPSHGLLTWAPFLVVLGAGTVLTDRRPGWVNWSALGGLVYLVLQWRANRFSGGDGHFGYRYPLEAMTAAAPALYLGYEDWVRGQPTRERFLRIGVAIAVALQAIAAVR